MRGKAPPATGGLDATLTGTPRSLQFAVLPEARDYFGFLSVFEALLGSSLARQLGTRELPTTYLLRSRCCPYHLELYKRHFTTKMSTLTPIVLINVRIDG